MEHAMDEAATARLSAAIGRWDQGATCLAALAVAAGGTGPSPLLDAARTVVAAAGLGEVLTAPERIPFAPSQLRGMAASPLFQGAAVVAHPDGRWDEHGDSTLIAQGQASGPAAALFAWSVLPLFPDLADRLARPGAQMLDVGTGIGALAVGVAEAFPQLHVTGIDVMPRVLQLARGNVAASPAASRVELRQVDVTELTDEACYDLAWIPAPFVPEWALRAGIARMVAALRPGGVLIVGHGSSDGDDLQAAINQFKTIAYGGTQLDEPSAASLLEQCGLTSVQPVPVPPGAPRMTVGRRAA